MQPCSLIQGTPHSISPADSLSNQLKETFKLQQMPPSSPIEYTWCSKMESTSISKGVPQLNSEIVQNFFTNREALISQERQQRSGN
jgi:hypothetical protein